MRTEIDRLIGNRFTEAHPLRSGRSGMKAFSQLVGLLRNCSDEDLARNIERIEKLLGTVGDCFSCDIKMRIFLSIFCANRIPEKASKYLKEAQEIQANSRTHRDYFQEVRDAINAGA